MSKLMFTRHGNAEKGDKDFERKLTLEGRRQAEALSQKLELSKLCVVIASPAQRTMETASIVAKTDTNKIVSIPEMYESPDETGRKICTGAFLRLGYGPLYKYRNDYSYPSFRMMAYGAADRILQELHRHHPEIDSCDSIALMVGHAVVLNEIVSLFLPAESPHIDLLLNTQLEECGTFELDTITKTVRIL